LNQATNVTFGGASNFALSLGDNVGPGPSAGLKLGNTAGIGAAQTANAQFGGSASYPVRTVTSNYTLANDDYTVLCNNAAALAPITITPPAAAASNKGRVYVVKRINPDVAGSNDKCQVAGVDGTSDVVLNAPPNSGVQESGVMIQSDGTQWWIIGSATGANAVVTWGSHNKAVSTGNNCISFNNVDTPSPCEVLFVGFMNDSTSTAFGPTPRGGMNISGLFARALGAGLTSTYTVDVISVDRFNVTTVLLSCSTVGQVFPLDTNCSDTGHAVVPGDVYLQVRVTADKSAPGAKWRAIFLY
jgi:hypothetical protein